MELNESNLHNQNTEQLISRMMSFLDEPSEIFINEDFDEAKNPLCTGIKTIVGMFPKPPLPQQPFNAFNTSYQSQREDQRPFPRTTRMKGNNNYEKACRYKDLYMHEVNKLMFCSTMGHPPQGSPEYFEAAENYALYGKEFLDFPAVDSKYSRPMVVGCFDGYASAQLQGSCSKLNSPQGFGVHTGKYPNACAHQLPVMLNSASYWASYPFYLTPNLIQPLMYSNPVLMTQYLNTFVRETQINTSIVQQHQFLSGIGGGGGGIQDRLVCAQMMQQQIQTTSQASGSFSSYSGHLGKQNIKLQEVKKSEVNQNCDFMKNKLNLTNLYENNLELDN